MNKSLKNTPHGKETIRLELSEYKKKTLVAVVEDSENMDPDKSLPFLLDPDEPDQQISFEKNYNTPSNEKDTSNNIQRELREQHLLSKPNGDNSPKYTNTKKMHVLGEGGMGRVFLAQQEYPSREVAIKEIKERTTKNEILLLREAMITGKIPHPNIIPIHELNIREMGPEIVMQRIEGQTLEKYLEGKPQRDKRLLYCLDILKDICNALTFAHQKGIFHRDIKPENIMLGNFGEIYLLDWGVALDKSDKTINRKIIVGSPSYMAPEMLTGLEEDITAKSDVYLLGSTLHEILTGKLRHNGKSLDDIFASVRTSLPFEYSDDIFEHLGDLCNKACHVDPNQRFPTVQDFQTKLNECIVHWNAIKICQQAQIQLHFLENERQKVFDTVSTTDTTQNNLTLNEIEINSHIDISSINKYYNQARFGYEQALVLWTECDIAKLGIRNSISNMLDITIQRYKYDTACNLFEDLQAYSNDPQLIALYKDKLDVLHKQERTKQKIIRSQDRSLTQATRKVIGNSIAIICSIIVSILLWYNIYVDAELHSQRFIFVILIADALILPVVINYKNILLQNKVGQTALFTILGGLLGLTVNRFIGWHFENDPHSILIIDNLILGLTVLNATPVLPSGKYLTILCVLISFISILFPTFTLFGQIICISSVTIVIAIDWSRR